MAQRKKSPKPEPKGKEEILSIEEFITRRRSEGKRDVVIAAELGIKMSAFDRIAKNLPEKESRNA